MKRFLPYVWGLLFIVTPLAIAASGVTLPTLPVWLAGIIAPFLAVASRLLR